MFHEYDTVRLKVEVEDYPAGTLACVTGVEDDGYWIEVYYPDDADEPDNVIFVEEDEIEEE